MRSRRSSTIKAVSLIASLTHDIAMRFCSHNKHWGGFPMPKCKQRRKDCDIKLSCALLHININFTNLWLLVRNKSNYPIDSFERHYISEIFALVPITAFLLVRY